VKDALCTLSTRSVKATTAFMTKLPKVIPFESLPPDLAKKFKNGGLRGAKRSIYEAKKLYEQIPSRSRTSPADTPSFLNGKEASHKVPYSIDKTKSGIILYGRIHVQIRPLVLPR
jgi:hypothetical protein